MRTLILMVSGIGLAAGACGDAESGEDDVGVCSAREVVAPAGRVCGAADEHCTVSLACGADVAGCVTWRGDLHVPDAFDEDDLAVLADLEQVDGSLSIFRPHRLVDLRGLEGLRAVYGTLSVTNDSEGNLRSLDGLDDLVIVGGLHIDGNAELADLRGLASLRIVSGDLSITLNPKLSQAEIDRVLACVRVDGAVTIENNGP